MPRRHTPVVASLAFVASLLLPVASVGSQEAASRDTVRATSLGAVVLRVGVDTSLTYAVRNGGRILVATYIESVSTTPEGYLIVGRNVRPNGATLSLDSLVVAPKTLAPVSHADSTPGGRTRVRFAAGRMRGTVDSGGRSVVIDSAVPAGMYDYSMASRLVNLLPLRVGYSVVVPAYDIHRGPQFNRVTVLAEEALEIRGRREPAWKVEIDYGRFRATRWIHRESRKDLRTVVSNGGMEMVVEYR
jgi:hypothetical protein